jgi:hypothetical protein
MKKTIAFLVIAAFVVSVVAVGTVMAAKKDKCTAIQDGTLVDTKGNPITMGYDQWGYNYQAHMFNGWYHNSPRPDPPYTKDTINQAPSKTWLMMKWNDAWLSNKDCDGNGLLDRHHGYDSYIGSGAWCTNHQKGSYDEDGKTCKWEYFVKIVAKPTADYDCEEHEGEEIWGAFCIIQSVYNDPCAGETGLEMKADIPGFGVY